MVLDARQLTTLQNCPRRLLLEADWEVLRWRPKSLFDALLRKGIIAISNGAAVRETAQSAKADYLQLAAQPGLDLPQGSNPYVIARDYCAMLDTVLHAAAKMNVSKLSPAREVRLNSSCSWQPLAALGEDGMLHRFITVDRWDEDALARELHGWYVFGDVAIARLAMVLHVFVIGQMRKGRRASAWARGWKRPEMPNLKMRFLKKDGTPAGGIPIYLAELVGKDADPEDWVAQMEHEGAVKALSRMLIVDVPGAEVCDDTLAQVLQEARRASVLLTERRSMTWQGMPMSRGACDGMSPCPYQPACHQLVTDLVSIGIYKSKNIDIVLPGSVPSGRQPSHNTVQLDSPVRVGNADAQGRELVPLACAEGASLRQTSD